MKIIYIHGFNSSGKSTKVDQLRASFPNYKIIAPTLSSDPNEAYSQIVSEIVKEYDDTIIIGTSLGGFYALAISNRFDIPCFLINPSLKPHKTLIKRVGSHIRFGTDNEVYEFKEQYLHMLKEISYEINANDQNDKLINVYISTDDEELDFSNIKSIIPKMNTYKEYDNCGHRFSKFSEIIPDIQECILEIENQQYEGDYLF